MAGTVGIGLTVVAPDNAAEAENIGPCHDSDGDGYGWNGVATCDPNATEVTVTNRYDYRLVDAPCLDTDGDGYGWATYGTLGESCTGDVHTFRFEIETR